MIALFLQIFDKIEQQIVSCEEARWGQQPHRLIHHKN